MAQLTFPTSPSTGQQYVGQNRVTYVWTGDRWSAVLAFTQRNSMYIIDGQYADDNYDPQIDSILDGGEA